MKNLWDTLHASVFHPDLSHFVISSSSLLPFCFHSRLAKEGDSLNEQQDDDTLQITPVSIVLFIGVICTILLLLYFFYKYLIFVVIGLFSIAACNGTFDCLRALASHITCCEYIVLFMFQNCHS